MTSSMIPPLSDSLEPPHVTVGRRFRLFFYVLAVVTILSLIKVVIHWFNLEFLTLNALFTSAIASAVFIIGFLLSSVLSDYKEADKLPAVIRSSLEAIYDDFVGFARTYPELEASAIRDLLLGLLRDLRLALGRNGHTDLQPVFARIDQLTEQFRKLELVGLPPNYVVRLKGEQSALRRSLFRLYHIQKIQFVPSVHILVQTLIGAIIFLLLFLKTEGSPESALIFGFISYMFIYALYLIDTLEQPFRKGRQSLDDVSLFLLREFEAKLLIFSDGDSQSSL